MPLRGNGINIMMVNWEVLFFMFQFVNFSNVALIGFLFLWGNPFVCAMVL